MAGCGVRPRKWDGIGREPFIKGFRGPNGALAGEKSL